MRRLITMDDVYELEFARLGKQDRDDRLRERAATFVEWANDVDRYELDEDVTRAHLLLVAAEHLFDLGDRDGAWKLAERASQQHDSEPFEAFPLMIEMRLELGDRDRAVALADEIRVARLGDWVMSERVAAAFGDADELALAERWFTIGAAQAQRGSDDDRERARLLNGRLRVRIDAGKDEDMLDAETSQLLHALGWGAAG